jgi:hypothetical protein
LHLKKVLGAMVQGFLALISLDAMQEVAAASQ